MDTNSESRVIKINKFLLTNVRCFGGEKNFNIRPLTFLIGENSTGKTTVLGCLQALADVIGRKNQSLETSNFQFNREPYQLGTFSNIARTNGSGQNERVQIGMEFSVGANQLPVVLIYELEKLDGSSEPGIRNICMKFTKGEINWRHDDSLEHELDIEISDTEDSFSIISRSTNFDQLPSPLTIFFFHVAAYRLNVEPIEIEKLRRFTKFLKLINFEYSLSESGDTPESNILSVLIDLLWGELFPPYDAIFLDSIAPIRSKPKRTYDSLEDIEDSEGAGVPTQLLNLFQTNRDKWHALQEKLEKFGRTSGLYENIEVKPFGDDESDPFRLYFKVRGGPEVNLVDVGYGVSQILPILTKIFGSLDRPGRTLLMQQPELHLHPKGQAWLMTQLVEAVTKYDQNFVIETHSDYMLDRARIEIMKGNISSNDVSLIFLEPDGDEVNVHNVEFDPRANMINLPDSYREFFKKETKELFGIVD